jgi:hypothetical protein
MSDLRAEILRFADTLNRGTGSVAAVDVAWKLRQIVGATPTTDPAPAAADPTAPYRELLGAIWLYVDWRYLTKQMTTEQKELWADAVDAFAEPQEGKAERWWREPAAPQAPAEPTGRVWRAGATRTRCARRRTRSSGSRPFE